MAVKNKAKSTKREVDLQNQLKRALADYDNLSKRVERQQEMYGWVAKTRFLAEILPAIDMFDRAKEHLADPGLAMAVQALDESLRMQGFERVQTKPGDKFDESQHEAVDVVEQDDKENGEIIEVKLVGWRSEDDIVRPAKVVVNRQN